MNTIYENAVKEIDKLIVPGNKVRVFFGNDNLNNCLYHVRAIVNDDKIVVRWWSRRTRQWNYVLKDRVAFVLMYLDAHLIYAGKS